MKKRVLSLIIGCTLACTACGSAESENREAGNAEPEHTVTDEADYSAYTKDYPVEKRDADYYWNINTDGFDKSMFDGVFSLYNNDFNGKITGKTLQANGFGIDVDNPVDSLLWNEDDNCYASFGSCNTLYKDGAEIGEVRLQNYNDESDFYSDHTEMSYYLNDAYCTFAEAVIPKCFVTEPEDVVLDAVTTDVVIEHLGVPTYVEGRRDSTAKNQNYFEYIYAYDDYVLIFGNGYVEGVGSVVTNFTYEGRLSYDQPCQYYDSDSGEFLEFNSPFEFLENDQKIYLESIK